MYMWRLNTAAHRQNSGKKHEFFYVFVNPWSTRVLLIVNHSVTQFPNKIQILRQVFFLIWIQSNQRPAGWLACWLTGWLIIGLLAVKVDTIIVITAQKVGGGKRYIHTFDRTYEGTKERDRKKQSSNKLDESCGGVW